MQQHKGQTNNITREAAIMGKKFKSSWMQNYYIIIPSLTSHLEDVGTRRIGSCVSSNHRTRDKPDLSAGTHHYIFLWCNEAPVEDFLATESPHLHQVSNKTEVNEIVRSRHVFRRPPLTVENGGRCAGGVANRRIWNIAQQVSERVHSFTSSQDGRSAKVGSYSR